MENIKIEFYVNHNDNHYCNTDVGINQLNNLDYPVKIAVKTEIKTIKEWEIKRPDREYLEKNNINPNNHKLKSVLPIIIRDDFKKYKSYYSEEEIKYLRYLLSKYCEVSDDKINEIFGCKDIITEMKNTIQPVQITQFKILRTDRNDNDYEHKDEVEEHNADIDNLINKLYSSSIINGQVGECDILNNTDEDDNDTNLYSVENLLGLNREELAYYKLIYSSKREELRGREFIIFIILDRLREYPDRILYFVPIEYPKDSKLNYIQIIENYIYSTFYTVSEPIQRRFITFLQRYCSEKENKYVKTKSYK